MKVENYSAEIAEALKNYDRYVVCIDKTPDQLLESLQSLIAKAIKVYESRMPGLKHGISLDHQVTIILSEPPESSAGGAANNGRPLCGIYFNLHSPYKRKAAPKKVGS